KLQGTLQINFSGETAFTPQQLRNGIAREIRAIEDYGLDEPNAYDAAFFLEAFYRRNGYSEVSVTSRITGPWQLSLIIVQGPRATIGGVTFQGNKAFDSTTLTKYLLGPTRERYPRIRKYINLPYVFADIQNGADIVSRFYLSAGYLNAVIGAPVVTWNAGMTSAQIHMDISEGNQYRFGEIRIEGNAHYPLPTLRALIAEQTGGIYTEGRLAAAERALEDYYTKRGYFQAKVTASANPAAAPDGRVPVVFYIATGSLYHFKGITVTGNEKVKSAFIKNRLRGLQGKTYDPALIDKQFRALTKTGLFRDLHIAPQPTDADEIQLDVTVEEAKAREFGIGLGFASFYGGIVDLSYRDLNIFHTGRSFSVNTELTQRGVLGELLYKDPWLFESDYSLNLRLYAMDLQLKGYAKNAIGFQPSLSRQLTEHWLVSGFLLQKYVSLHHVEIQPSSLTGPQNYSVTSAGLSQTFDFRNNALLPSRGFILVSTLEFAPQDVSDISFLRASMRFSYYVPVTARSYLAFGARAGIMSSLNQSELPIDERFFNGGATTVRSFSEFTLGPKDRVGYPIGGEGYTVFNAEYTFPIIGDLQGAFFFDAGNVVQNAANFGLENMRYGIGAGFRYKLPIGAIRLDYGLNPSPQQGEAQGAFQFAIGVAF
ncbi:MAG: outer membrane protein assembly factor BamA, partial [Chthoniobacterales bacterium]